MLSFCFGGCPISPSRFLSQVTFAVHFSAYVYIYIYVCVILHVALPVKTSVVILLWGEVLRHPPNFPFFFSKSHLRYTSLHKLIYIYIYIYIYIAEMVDGVEVFNGVVIGMKTLTNQMEYAPASLFSHRATQFDPGLQ